jgi:hypothetical protein
MDKRNIPELAYHNLALVHKSLPRHHAIQKRKKELTSALPIFTSSANEMNAVFQPFDVKLQERVQVLSEIVFFGREH